MNWVDELDHSEPLPVLEPFFILVALELGDPDSERYWLSKNATPFYKLYSTYKKDTALCLSNSGADILIQYIIWYERESRKAHT